MKLDSTVAAVVTGGASGLGEATARALAAKGVKVAIFDLQADKGEALAAEIGGVFCNVNVTSDESVDAGAWSGTYLGKLRWHGQRGQDRQPFEGRRVDQAFSARCV
jgi:hypothetical protein